MAVYPDGKRMEMVADLLRREGPLSLTEATSILSRTMASKTTWKALNGLMDAGMVVRTRGTAPSGHLQYLYDLEWWYALDEEQRERLVAAVESIAESMRVQTERMTGGMETKQVSKKPERRPATAEDTRE